MSLFQLNAELVAADLVLKADAEAGYRESASLARLEAARSEIIGALRCSGFEFQTMVEEGPTHWVALGLRRAVGDDDTATFVRLTLDTWNGRALAYAARFNGQWMEETPSSAKNLVRQLLHPEGGTSHGSMWVSAMNSDSPPADEDGAPNFGDPDESHRSA